MQEEIEIEFNDDGEIVVKTEGMKGPVCLSEVTRLLEGLATITNERKTDEYYSEISVDRAIQEKTKVGKR